MIFNHTQFVLIVGIGLSLFSVFSQTANAKRTCKSSADNTIKLKPQIATRDTIIVSLETATQDIIIISIILMSILISPLTCIYSILYSQWPLKA